MALVNAVENEEARLNALRDLHLLDTPPSDSFDRLTRLASQLLAAPVSTISLTDHDRQWFKSKVGVDLAEIPREQAPCNYAIQGDGIFVVPDLLEDERFRDSPLAKAGIRFYAGAPLFTRSGYGLGTLCVVDATPRKLSDDEGRVLQDLAGMVMSQIDLQNMIGRVDASSGFANQHQLFEDIENAGRVRPGQRQVALLVDLVSSDQAHHGLRVLGDDYAETLIRAAMRVIRRHLDPGTLPYHVGQARCAILLSPEAADGADALAAEIVTALREPILCGGIPVSPTPVVGTYAFLAGEVAPRDVLRRLFNAADDARLDETGVAHYSPAHDLHHARRFMLLNDFRAALEADDQLSLVYQPRVDLETGRCLGVEALLRWRHPQLGAISPAEFVPIVEQTALIRSMTDWVVATALTQAREWARLGLDLTVSLNSSAHNLDEADFAGRLLLAVQQSGLDPRHLELEFTESAIARDNLRVIGQLEDLRRHGIEVAIDDFGTGYSNLSYLQQLPISVLKIDRSFMDGVAGSARDQTLVRTMITMAHDLGYRVVAEGIETAEVYQRLAEWGCDEGQGYFMSRPVSAAELGVWLRQRNMAKTQASGERAA